MSPLAFQGSDILYFKHFVIHSLAFQGCRGLIKVHVLGGSVAGFVISRYLFKCIQGVCVYSLAFQGMRLVNTALIVMIVCVCVCVYETVS